LPGLISIGASGYADIIKLRLDDELKQLENCGLKIKIEENPAGKYTFLSCTMAEEGYYLCGDDSLALFKNYVADILADLIICKWQKIILRDIIRENYYYFGEEDRSTIYNNALRYLDEYNPEGKNPVQVIRKKRKIFNKIIEFLNACNHIDIDGFIRFRLKEYTRDLQEAADKAVDDFLLDREYKEFIQLLRYFVDIQDSRTDMLNVVMKPNGVFKLYDRQKRVINSAYLEGFIIDLVDSEINYEDLLISALVTLAPREIVFHMGEYAAEDQGVLETIKNIFSQRVSVCRGCELCKDPK